MYDVITSIKSVAVVAISSLLAFIAPIQMDLLVVIVMCLGNFIIGLFESYIVKNEAFSMKKFRAAMVELLVYVGITIFIYFVFSLKGIIDSAIYCSNTISYSVIYFLGINMLRNMRSMMPKSKVIKFLYYVGAFEFAKKLPFISEFNDFDKKN